MPQYDFGSTGAAMGQALIDLLAQREALKRQQMLDEIAKRNTESQIEDRAKNRELQDASIKHAEEDRRFRRASTIAENSLPGDEFDTETSRLLTEAGLGGTFRPTEVPGMLQTDGETADTRDPNRIANIARGGSKYVAAREAARERASTDRARLATTENEKARDRESREFIASMANTSREAIAGAGRQAKEDAAAEKRTAAEKDLAGKRKAAQLTAQEAIDAINELLTPEGQLAPGVSRLIGGVRVPAFVSRNVGDLPLPGMGGVSGQQATLDRISGQLIVNLINEMKQQSRTGATGFGALSEKELQLLQRAAAGLNQAQDEESFRKELERIRTKLGAVYQDAPTQTTSSTAEEFDRLVKQYGQSTPVTTAPSMTPAERIAAARARRP